MNSSFNHIGSDPLVQIAKSLLEGSYSEVEESTELESIAKAVEGFKVGDKTNFGTVVEIGSGSITFKAKDLQKTKIPFNQRKMGSKDYVLSALRMMEEAPRDKDGFAKVTKPEHIVAALEALIDTPDTELVKLSTIGGRVPQEALISGFGGKFKSLMSRGGEFDSMVKAHAARDYDEMRAIAQQMIDTIKGSMKEEAEETLSEAGLVASDFKSMVGQSNFPGNIGDPVELKGITADNLSVKLKPLVGKFLQVKDGPDVARGKCVGFMIYIGVPKLVLEDDKGNPIIINCDKDSQVHEFQPAVTLKNAVKESEMDLSGFNQKVAQFAKAVEGMDLKGDAIGSVKKILNTAIAKRLLIKDGPRLMLHPDHPIDTGANRSTEVLMGKAILDELLTRGKVSEVADSIAAVIQNFSKKSVEEPTPE